MSTPTAQVRVTLDKAQAERDAETLGGAIHGALVDALGGVRSAADLAALAIENLSAAFNAAYDFVREGVIASAEAAVGEARLEQALRLRGVATEGVVDQLNAYNSALMQSTGLADDQLLALQTQLVALGVQRDRLQEATAAAIGLAEVSGKDLVSAGTTVVRVLDGQVGALKRLGIDVDSSAEAMERLVALSRLAGSTLSTSAGQWSLLQQNVGEVKEALGDPIARSGGLIGALKAANEFAVGLTESVGALGDKANAVAGGDALGSLGSAVVEMARVQFPMLVSGTEALVGGFRSVGRKAAEAAKQAKSAFDDTVSVVDTIADRMGRLSVKEILDRFGGKRQSGITDEAKREADKRKKDAEAEAKLRMRDYSEGFVGPVDPDLENFRLIEQRDALAFDLARARQDTLRQIEADGNEARFQDELAAYDKRQAAQDEFFSSAISGVAQFGLSLAGNLGRAAATGQSAGDVILGTLGSIMSTVGASLFGLGLAAVTAGNIGTVAPWLLAVTGGPLGTAAGVAAMVVGAGMAVGGGFLSSVAGGSGGASARGGGGGASRGASAVRTEADRQTFGSGGSGPVNSTFIVNVTGGVWGMDSPRALRDMLDDADRLEPRRRFAS